ncbi:MAG TPA: ABC transporter substrate-binding protein [Pseudonocardia sp.]|jgi:ABC-type nitrate/sulfonate/bicarbonate transport system substrate-binding protein|nr:ABC transporter substrate-binding protein [Pseudonocardia sp.]
MDDAQQRSLLRAPMGRRGFLGAALGGAAALAGGSLLAGCATNSGAGGSSVTVQLIYILNSQFAGSIMAEDRNFFRGAGVDVTLVPGAPNAVPELAVQSGKALVGITHPSKAVKAIANGADLKIIGADYQKNPFCIVSNAEKAIRTPQDLVGKKIGVPDINIPLFQAFLTANNIPVAAVQTVKAEFDPQPVASGEFDGFMGFYSDEPVILEVMGIPNYALRFGDFNYPSLAELYIVKNSTLADREARKKVAGVLKGSIQGWQVALADPDEAGRVVTARYGKQFQLDPVVAIREARRQRELVADQDTQAHGLLWMTDEKIAGTCRSLSLGGLPAKPEMFSNEVLQDVYQGKTTL